MIKTIFVIIFFSLLFSACSVNQMNQNGIFTAKKIEREAVSKELFDEISYILFLIKQQDLETLNNRFINSKIGFYDLFKTDIENKVAFIHKFKIEELYDNIDSYEIKQEIPIFNCSPYDDAFYGWSKDGVFLTTDIKPYVSLLMLEANKLEPNRYKQEELDNISLIEKTSYELIITNNVIFYLTKIDNKWYITLIDRLKTDCSN